MNLQEKKLCNQATNRNHYRFNLIRYTSAKPNLQKPNAIMGGWLTVLCYVRKSTRRFASDLNYTSIIA